MWIFLSLPLMACLCPTRCWLKLYLRQKDPRIQDGFTHVSEASTGVANIAGDWLNLSVSVNSIIIQKSDSCFFPWSWISKEWKRKLLCHFKPKPYNAQYHFQFILLVKASYKTNLDLRRKNKRNNSTSLWMEWHDHTKMRGIIGVHHLVSIYHTLN